MCADLVHLEDLFQVKKRWATKFALFENGQQKGDRYIFPAFRKKFSEARKGAMKIKYNFVQFERTSSSHERCFLTIKRKKY